MTRARFTYALLAVALIAPRAAAGEEGGPGKVESFTLGNGMQVVVIADHRVPAVTHMVWYRAGAADDPPGTSGVAHFLEHLMFKGTATRASGDFARTITRLGGRDNAFTLHDLTYYFQRVAKEHLATVMALEADRMANLRIIEGDAVSERDVVREERRATVESNPLNLLGEQMMATLYPGHPYGRPVLGVPDDIARLSHADASTFYARHYAPNNATLVVAGAATAEEVRSLAESTYGRVKPAAALAPHAVAPPKEPEAARRVELRHERAGAGAVLRFYPTPGAARADPALLAALDVLAHVIGGDDTSRMHRALVTANLADTAGASHVSNTREGGRIALLLLPVEGVDLARAQSLLDAVLEEIRAKGVTDDEIARAKSALQAQLVFDADNQMLAARRYGEGLSIGRSVADIAAIEKRLADVTVDSVNRAAARYLDPARSVSGILSSPKASP